MNNKRKNIAEYNDANPKSWTIIRVHFCEDYDMKRKTLLIGITSCALMITTLSAALTNSGSLEAFAQTREAKNYTAVINSSNRLKATDTGNRYGFQLHGNDEYGCFYFGQYWFDVNPTEAYSDYILSWTMPEGKDSSYFQISVCDRGEELANKYKIDGKDYYLRGFPGAYRVTTVYSLSDPDLRFYTRGNSGGWTETSKTIDGNLITLVTEKTSESSSMRFDWILSNPGTVYIKSITIEYTCE